MHLGFALQRHALPGGGYLAQLSLNAPQHLNALSHEMVELLLRQLCVLEEDDEALVVILDSSCDRAFCVGADLRRINESAMANPGGVAVEAEAFFVREFEIVHRVYHFNKPLLCWADGFTLGSGLSLLAGASHRVIGSSVDISLPEVGIGFFPNAGLSYYLNQMPGGLGAFIGFTGIPLNITDVLYGGLADYCFSEGSKQQVLQGLMELDWEEDAQINAEILTEYLTDLEVELGGQLPESELKRHRNWIDQHCNHQRGGDILPLLDKQLQQLRVNQSWLQQARHGFNTAAASSQIILQRLLGASENSSLAEVLRLELNLAVNRVRDPEFTEGVRSRLISRDRDPRWCYASFSAVPESEVEALFISPWDEHPLAHL